MRFRYCKVERRVVPILSDTENRREEKQPDTKPIYFKGQQLPPAHQPGNVLAKHYPHVGKDGQPFFTSKKEIQRFEAASRREADRHPGVPVWTHGVR